MTDWSSRIDVPGRLTCRHDQRLESVIIALSIQWAGRAHLIQPRRRPFFVPHEIMIWRVTMSSKIPVVEMAGPPCGLLQGGAARPAGVPV
jgi:hypothetical protein